MKTERIRHTPDTLPELSPEQRVQLAEAANQPDEALLDDDMPELTDDQLANALQGRFYRPVKQQITARIDADVLAWLKSRGKGYQVRLNAILRREMLASLKTGKRD